MQPIISRCLPTMRFLNDLTEYCEKNSTSPDKLLKELERETHLKTLAPQMLSGHLQGQFLSMVSCWVQPSAILEIGTFTGYGTICLARGLAETGTLHTIEVNPELTYISRKYFQKAGLDHKIQHYIGDARDLIPKIDADFDLAYIDAGKNDYALHYDLAFEKMKPGGVLLIDNVLWSGKVIEGLQDRDTQTIEAFNQKLMQDNRVDNLLLPIRDGIMIARKK